MATIPLIRDGRRIQVWVSGNLVPGSGGLDLSLDSGRAFFLAI